MRLHLEHLNPHSTMTTDTTDSHILKICHYKTTYPVPASEL